MKIEARTGFSPEIIYPEGAEQINHWVDNEGKEHFKEISHKKPPIESNWNRVGRKITYDSKGKKIYIYYSVNIKTNEKRIKFCIEGHCFTYTKNNYFELDIEGFFASNESIHYNINKEQILEILREKYSLEIIKILIEEKETTVKDFSKLLNIKEQMGRKHLKRFERLGLLISFRHLRGGIKVYKSALKEEKIKEIATIFI